MPASPATDLASAMTAVTAGEDAVAATIVGAAALRADSRDAVAVIGGRVVAELDWDRVADDDAVLPAIRTILLLEARGVGDDRLARALPHLATAAEAIDAPMVISLGDAQIDVVAGALLGRGAQLLCDPSLADRTLAVALAAQAIGAPILHDNATHEGEAARLRRLNDEVARIAEVLSKLTRRDAADPAPSMEVGDRHHVFAAPPGEAIVIEPGEIRRAIRGRRLRDQHFGPGFFEEPAWDMILDLFAAELESARVSVSSLCIAAAVAPTTALRWISKLVEAGLFERQPDPFDRRRAYMELSERASRAMRDYVAALRRAGMSLS